MSMKLNPTLTFWHQILPLIVNNFLHILHIHSQIACEVIHLHIPTHSEPRILLNDVKFLSLFLVLNPLLHRKTWSVVGHFKIDQNTPCSGHFLLHIKHNPFKDQTVFLRRHFDHRSNLRLVQLGFSCSFFRLKIKGWFLFRWRRCHLF